MGYILLPGHKRNASNGWQELTNLKIDFLDNIKLGRFEIGNFGDKFNDSIDKYAAPYSIPNPWASAYLFHNVLNDNSHPLLQSVIKLLLNLLNDFHNYKKLKLIDIQKPDSESPFYIFWKLAPDFIKYGDKIFFFKDCESGKIQGGLSKTTLCWTAQHYVPVNEIESLINDLELSKFVKFIKEQNVPNSTDGMEFSKYWSHKDFVDLLRRTSEQSNFVSLGNSPVKWLVINNNVQISCNKYKYNEWLIFDEDALLNDKYLLGKSNPQDFEKELRSSKKGEYLPLNQGKNKWIIFEELLEKHWIQLTRLSDDEKEKSYQGKYLFPIKPEYLKIGFDLNLINERNDIQSLREYTSHRIMQIYIDNNGNKQKFKHEISGKKGEDKRCIAIWPPFPSKIIETHIIEYNIDGIDTLHELEFYTKDGMKLDSTPIRQSQDIRVYKLDQRNVFPEFLRIVISDDFAGLLRIKPKNTGISNKTINVGLDFGSTHTTVAYKFIDGDTSLDNELMTFENSSPIIIADEENEHALLVDFLPKKVLKDAPQEEKYYPPPGSKPFTTTWSPIRTLWKILNEEKNEFLESGVIPLEYDPEMFLELDKNIKENLKWSGIARFRNGFLTHLLNMILVECEALGCSNVNIYWSYPRSFSRTERNTMNAFYKDYKEKIIGKIRDTLIISIPDSGYSEALRTMKYFIHQDRLIQNKIAATIDIGGGTSDITFLKHNEILWEDSVKFGGDDISTKMREIVETLSTLRGRRNAYIGRTYNYNQLIRTWPAVHKTWNNSIADFINTNVNKNKFIEKFALFYGGLCYYLGLHLRSQSYRDPLNQIAFAGNGTQFLKICSVGNELNEQTISEWFKLFRKMVAFGQGINYENYQDTEFIFSKDPKKEVAFGLTHIMIDRDDLQEVNLVRMLGLRIKKDSIEPKEYDWNQWTDAYNSKQISSLFYIDFTIFEEFLKSFYESLKRIGKEEDTRGIFFNISIPEEIIIKESFKTDVISEIAKREDAPLATPLFFTALKKWIEKRA